MISIHALLAESDCHPGQNIPGALPISIHALLAESDCMTPMQKCCVSIFLSTLSLRRATHYSMGRHEEPFNFYPRSPCGERRQQHLPDSTHRRISIHALLAESDSAPRITPAASRNFYPRSPCGERRNARPETHQRDAISIHALLAESDFRQF